MKPPIKDNIHSLVVMLSRDVKMNHDEGDNYKCKKCKKMFANPMQASIEKCEVKE